MPKLATPVNPALGQRLRAIRVAHGSSQRWLADAVGQDQGTIWRWETGQIRIPAEDLNKLAKALDVPVNQFFEEELTHVH